jgi:hypothetical protein
VLFYWYRKRVEDKRTVPPSEEMIAAGTPAPIAGASDP